MFTAVLKFLWRLHCGAPPGCTVVSVRTCPTHSCLQFLMLLAHNYSMAWWFAGAHGERMVHRVFLDYRASSEVLSRKPEAHSFSRADRGPPRRIPRPPALQCLPLIPLLTEDAYFLPPEYSVVTDARLRLNRRSAAGRCKRKGNRVKDRHEEALGDFIIQKNYDCNSKKHLWS